MKSIITFSFLMLTSISFSQAEIETEEYFSPPPIQLEKKDSIPVYEFYDNDAEFPGGRVALMQYLSNNIILPAQVKKEKLMGKIIARFTIDSTGSTTNIKILKNSVPSCELCEKEFIRVIQSMPKWKPAIVRNRNVESYYTLPIQIHYK